MRQYLGDYCCYECYPSYLVAIARVGDWQAIVAWTLCVVLIVVAVGLITWAALTQQEKSRGDGT